MSHENNCETILAESKFGHKMQHENRKNNADVQMSNEAPAPLISSESCKYAVLSSGLDLLPVHFTSEEIGHIYMPNQLTIYYFFI